jgi:hypothetical protein
LTSRFVSLSYPRRTDAKKLNDAKTWTSDEDERLRELVISNVSVIDIAADLGRTVKAVRARAHTLRIALGRSRFRVNAKAKRPHLVRREAGW